MVWKTRAKRGLTLIEILIALIVLVLGVIGILALFPPALESSKQSMEETQASIMANSFGHALATAIHFSRYNATSGDYEVTVAHDMEGGSGGITYTFTLPSLTDAPKHHPGTADETGDVENEPHFTLGGDAWVRATVDNVHATNDPSDAYTQFAFSFTIRKLNTLEYLLNKINPETGANYTLDELDLMTKLFEYQIYVFRLGSSNTKRLITGPIAGRVSLK